MTRTDPVNDVRRTNSDPSMYIERPQGIEMSILRAHGLRRMFWIPRSS
jgi:hypothetical protein